MDPTFKYETTSEHADLKFRKVAHKATHSASISFPEHVNSYTLWRSYRQADVLSSFDNDFLFVCFEKGICSVV